MDLTKEPAAGAGPWLGYCAPEEHRRDGEQTVARVWVFAGWPGKGKEGGKKDR